MYIIQHERHHLVKKNKKIKNHILKKRTTTNINNHHRAIRREFEPVGPTLLKSPLRAGWGLLPTLQWAGSWLPTNLVTLNIIFSVKY